jgi:hypothetical protein
MAELRRAIHQAVGEAEIKGLFESLLRLARCGNMEAARLVLAYSVGKPPAYDPDALEGGEQ